MSIEIENARKLVALEERAKAAATELGRISLELRSFDKDLKLSGWDWKRSSNIAEIMPQGTVGVSVVNIDARPV